MKKIIIGLPIIMMIAQGLFIVGCGKREQASSIDEQANQQSSDDTSVTDEKADNQSDEQANSTIDEQKNEAPPNPYPDAIIELVKPTIVKAIITKDTEVTKTENKDSKIIGYLRKGEIVEIIRDKLYKRYLVRTNKSEGWVDREVLEIPKEEPANQTRLTKEQAEGFIEQQGLTSKTKYLIWVDIDRQLLNIFIRDGDKWKLYKTMVCATGKNESPTIRGIFKLQDRGLWFYSEAFKAGAKYWVRIQDSYLIHSVPMNKNKQVIDSTLGKRVSSGCIRLAVEDAKWVYYNIPQDTTIYIN